MALDPLAVVASLCGQGGEVLSLRLHAMQDRVAPEDLAHAVEKVGAGYSTLYAWPPPPAHSHLTAFDCRLTKPSNQPTNRPNPTTSRPNRPAPPPGHGHRRGAVRL
jgi:hypothetical protein